MVLEGLLEGRRRSNGAAIVMTLRGLVSILCVLAATPATNGADSAGSLSFFYDLYTFRGNGDSTTVVATIAVPVGELRRERTDGRFRYRFDVRLVLADTVRRSVLRTMDSVFVSVERPLAGQHLLHTHVELQAPPSAATLQRVIVTDASRPGVGQLYNSPFPIPDYSGTDLMLSDIAFGLPDATVGWTRRGVTLALLPTSQFPESSFDVYYEIYNLPAGNPYETEISLQILDDSDDEDRVVRTLFSGESAARPDGSVGELRRVESALPKGRYSLTVTVTDKVSGQSAARSRLVEVRGWGRGATLVPAMPYRSRTPAGS
jgi:hypothetical protein